MLTLKNPNMPHSGAVTIPSSKVSLEKHQVDLPTSSYGLHLVGEFFRVRLSLPDDLGHHSWLPFRFCIFPCVITVGASKLF